jgi:hypothetical protein
MKEYILKNSTNKGKRYVIVMDNMNHHFGSDVGKTYIDGRTDKEKNAWEARHKGNKNYNDIHASIFWSKNLLWNKKSLKESIKSLEKKLNIKIKNNII